MKKPLKIILYSVLGLIGIVFLTFLPGIILGLFMISGGCGDEVIQTIPLEKGKIELHQGNCGATTDFTYDLRWKTTNKKSKSLTSLELSYGEPYFKVLEETKNKIVISYSPGTKLEDTHIKIDQKDIYFKRRTVKINKPTDFLSLKRSLKGLDLNFYINNISIYKHPESLENQTEFAIDDKGFKNNDYDSTWYPIGFINANDNEISSTLFVHTIEKNYPVYIDVESKKKTEKRKSLLVIKTSNIWSL